MISFEPGCCRRVAVVDVFPSGEERLAVELKLLPGERRLEEATLVDEEGDPDDHADREELWKDTHMTSTELVKGGRYFKGREREGGCYVDFTLKPSTKMRTCGRGGQ